MSQTNKCFEIPLRIIQKDGPFKEFKQDVCFVSVELDTGIIYEHLLVHYPNTIIAMKGQSVLPFNPIKIVRVFQSTNDLKLRSDSNWKFWLN